MRFAVGIVAFWALLAILAEYERTADLAIAVAWATAIGMTFASADEITQEIERLKTGGI